MNLSIYDILSHLIPGFLVYASMLYSFNIDIDRYSTITATALAYFIGYIINAISSWSESILHLSWGGKPSDNLLEGKPIWKVAMFEGKRVKKMLLADCGNKHASNDELFEFARRNVNFDAGTHLSDFNAAYSFSRSILISVLFGLIMVIISNPDVYLIIIGTVIFFITWLRTKQKTYYFVREVFIEYMKLKNLSKPYRRKTQ